MPASEQLSIRPIQPSDYARWSQLWQGYLDFYKVTIPQSVSDQTWRRIVDGRDNFSAFVAVDLTKPEDQAVIGFAICLLHPSTWSEKPSCYLEDLYVDETARGLGAGRALIETIYQFANALDCHRVYWVTDENNSTARALYDRVASYSGHIQYRRRGD